MALWSTHSLTEINTRSLPGVKGGRRVRLTTLPQTMSRLSRENVVVSTSHVPVGLHGLSGVALRVTLMKRRRHTACASSARETVSAEYCICHVCNDQAIFRPHPHKLQRMSLNLPNSNSSVNSVPLCCREPQTEAERMSDAQARR
jgi:hypothetical protein